MALLLLAAFILVPLIEIGLFIEIGGWLGLWPTLGLILLTAFVGTALLRQQGLATLRRAQSQLDSGQLPAKELFDGVCLLAGGLLLLTPGFFTDAVGFALLIPPFRDILRRFLGKHVTTIHMRHGRAAGHAGHADPRHHGPGPDRQDRQGPERPPGTPGRGWGRPKGPAPGQGPTIDGDYVDVTDETDPTGRPERPDGTRD